MVGERVASGSVETTHSPLLRPGAKLLSLSQVLHPKNSTFSDEAPRTFSGVTVKGQELAAVTTVCLCEHKKPQLSNYSIITRFQPMKSERKHKGDDGRG